MPSKANIGMPAVFMRSMVGPMEKKRDLKTLFSSTWYAACEPWFLALYGVWLVLGKWETLV